MSSKSPNSYGQILRTSTIIGSATVVVLLSNLLKIKVAALLLGPAGVGLIGLFQKLVAIAAMIAGLGTDSAGTRRVAVFAKNERSLRVTRRALFIGAVVLSTIGGIVFFAVSLHVDRYFLQDVTLQLDVAWLAVGVAASIMASYHTALFTGLRRMEDIGRIRALGGVLSALIGSLAIWQFGHIGILVMVISAPLSTLAIGYLSLFGIKRSESPQPSFRELLVEWQSIIGAGTLFMLSGLICLASELTIRTLIQWELGLVSLGHFHASWSISVAYLGLTIGALGADFLPKLSSAMQDKKLATRLINEQTEIMLLICGPILLVLMAFAPSVLQLLYSAEFTPVANVLRIQLLADVLKILAWPLSLSLMAAGTGRAYFITEGTASVVLVLVVAVGLSRLELMATGVSYIIVYAVTLPLLFIFARRRIGFSWSSAVLRDSALLLSAALLVAVASLLSETIASIAGLSLASAGATFAIVRIKSMSNLTGRSACLVALFRKWLPTG